MAKKGRPVKKVEKAVKEVLKPIKKIITPVFEPQELENVHYVGEPKKQ